MPDRDSIRVLIVDDHDVVHWGFRLLLGRQPWVAECEVARGREDAVEAARRVRPRVALVDLLLGEDSGAEVCEEIRAASPETKVLLISGAGRISPTVARAAGASGFISKDWSAADVVKAVRMVYRGRTEPDSLATTLRASIEANGWRHLASTTVPGALATQVYEKAGDSLQVRIWEGGFLDYYTYVEFAAGRQTKNTASSQ